MSCCAAARSASRCSCPWPCWWPTSSPSRASATRPTGRRSWPRSRRSRSSRWPPRPSILSGGGGLDLSVGPLAIFCNILIVHKFFPGSIDSGWAAVPLLLAIGAAVGAANGVLVTVLRYQPVIATLCTFFVLIGINFKMARRPGPRRGQLDGQPRRPGGLLPRCADPDPRAGRGLARADAGPLTTGSCTRWAAMTRRLSPPASTSTQPGSSRTRSAGCSPRSPASRSPRSCSPARPPARLSTR